MANWIIDRTINLDEYKTREVLKALLIKPRLSDGELERLLHEKKVLKNEGDGALRRRWYTYLRNYGLLKNDDVTEIGEMYANEKLNLAELALIQLMKKRIKLSNEVFIYPFKVVSLLLLQLSKTSKDEAYLSPEEFSSIVVNTLNDNETTIIELSKQIMEIRRNHVFLSIVEGQHHDIWLNTFKQTGLFEYIGHSLYVKDFKILDKVCSFYSSSDLSNVEYGKLDFEFIKNIPLPIKANKAQDIVNLKRYSDLPNILFDFFFSNCSIRRLEDKYFSNRDNYNGMITILQYANIERNNLSIYEEYSSYPNIVVMRLLRCDDKEIQTIARIIQKRVAQEIVNSETVKEKFDFDFNSSPIKDGHNLIVYGTPGCGKSYYVEHTLLVGFDYIRTTFFQDYTNTDFVGQILPVVEGEKVTYEFNPGPFTLALVKAIQNPNQKVALVIEELNRGSAASIFGDIFQLLDRKNGVSEYGIKNVNIIKYLNKQFENKYKFDEIKLPGNFFIFATMNTSDQNVFTLDTAFKRRWCFKKLLNKFESNHSFKDKYIPGLEGEFNKTWEELVSMINDYILSNNDGLNNEDKQLGVYFVDESGMRKSIEDVSTPEQVDAFCYKVLEYLWSDVSKFQRNKWFAGDIKSLDQLVEEYKKQGLKVFNDDVTSKK